MKPHQSPQSHLDKLRTYRNRPPADLSLGFMQAAFKKDIQKPYKQLAGMVKVWEQLVPQPLQPKTRLESLSHGVLRVIVDSSSTLYELDRLLRQGLQQAIIRAHQGPAMRRIQLRVGVVETHRQD